MKPITLPVRVEKLADGRTLAYSDAIQGCLAEGDTLQEALENIEGVARALLEVLAEDGEALPPGMGEFQDVGFRAKVKARI